MAESFCIVPENIFGKITFISVSGVFARYLCIKRLLGILIMSVFCILSSVGLFSPTSNKNLATYID